MSRIRRTSFVVRVVEDRRGQLNGVIERVATGAKEAFSGIEVIGPVIQRMLRRDGAAPPAGSSPRASGAKPGLAPRKRRSRR
jgi:hypothetical protein